MSETVLTRVVDPNGWNYLDATAPVKQLTWEWNYPGGPTSASFSLDAEPTDQPRNLTQGATLTCHRGGITWKGRVSSINRDGWQVGGGASTVDATSWDATEGYTVTSAPSMRMVVSLADFDDSRWINLTGVSGHPFDSHFTDQTDLWADGKTLPWAFSPDAVTDAGEDVLTLEPGDTSGG